MTTRKLAATVAWVAMSAAMTTPGLTQMRKIGVDAGSVVGTIRSLQGVNLGPLGSRPNSIDLSKQYKDIGVDLIRTHDNHGPTDIDMFEKAKPVPGIIFPNMDLDADKEESYVFGPSDRIIKGIVDNGAQVYYRLGRTFGWADPTMPYDFDKFANICKHVAMHYNSGWANGFHFNIRYWELWNEPNVMPDWTPGERFPVPWGGPAIQFFHLYEKVAQAIKSYDPKLKMGACGLAEGQRENVFREGLIEYCADHNVPLDFFSWHHYSGDSSDPYDLVRVAHIVRDILDTNGFQNAENHCNEWNLSVSSTPTDPQNQSSMESAAFAATALIYMQGVVDVSAYYAGTAGGMGMFERDGSYRKKAYVFKANGKLLATPQRLAVSGADTIGFAVLAGRSADSATVQILVANYEIQQPTGPPQQTAAPGSHPLARRKGIRYDNNRGYDLTVNNLPWGAGEFTVQRYRVSKTENLDLVGETSGRGGTFALTNPLPPPAVELIVLRRK
jgi:hypothetical protein